MAIRVATVVEFLDLLSWLLTYLLKSAGFTHTILPIAWVNFFNKFSVCCVFCPMLTLLNWKECFAKVLFHFSSWIQSGNQLHIWPPNHSRIIHNVSQILIVKAADFEIWVSSRSDFNKSRNSGTYFTLAVTFIYFSWNQWAFKSLFSSQLHPTFFFIFLRAGGIEGWRGISFLLQILPSQLTLFQLEGEQLIPHTLLFAPSPSLIFRPSTGSAWILMNFPPKMQKQAFVRE